MIFTFTPTFIGKALLYYLGAVSITFWNMSGTLQKKWIYSSNLYNDILKANKKKRPLLINALAIDLLILDLWAHRSFAELFADELEENIEQKELSHNQNDMFDKVNDGRLPEHTALKLLEDRQRILIKERDEEYQ